MDELIGIIGGTGFEALSPITFEQQRQLSTDYGPPSGAISMGRWHGTSVAFLSRHGSDHAIAPHVINYRANMKAMEMLGCTAVISINAVGGIHPDMLALGYITIPDQIIDYTSARINSFWNDPTDPSIHVDFTEPYDESLRQSLIDAALLAQVPHSSAGTYAATNGPRLETAAEIRRLQRDDCDVVGMTGMPEAVLARELALPYASLCFVLNPAAGLGSQPLNQALFDQAMELGCKRVVSVLDSWFAHMAIKQ